LEKERSNFCDYFKFASENRSSGKRAEQVDARKKLEELFLKK